MATLSVEARGGIGTAVAVRRALHDRRVTAAMSAAMLASSAFAGIANAQSQPASLGEIVVTAEKREVPLSDVAVSMSVIGGPQIEQFGITDFASYGSLVPGLSGQIYEGNVQNRGPRTIGLRGVQSLNLTFFGGQNTVGFYIDDTPISVVNPRLVALERIEVLRGPQGTLYGSSSLGGTVKLVTRKPNIERVEGMVAADLSSTNHGGTNYSVEGSINLPLASRAALRASGYYERLDGYIDFTPIDVFGVPTGGRGIKRANENTSYGGIAALALQLSDTFTITPSIVYSHVASDSADFYNEGRGVQANHFLQPGMDEFKLYSVALQWDLGFGTINSTSAYFDMDSTARRDLTDFFGAFTAPAPALLLFDNFITQKDFVHETRFTSKFGGPGQLIGGVFYTNRKEDSGSKAPAPGINSIFGIPVQNQSILESSFRRDRREVALFGEVGYEIASQWKVVGGLRWFDVKYENTDVAPALFNGYDATPSTPSAAESDTIFKGRVEFRPSEGQLLYAAVAQGYRMGGANPPIPSPVCDQAVGEFFGTATPKLKYKSDSLTSYELGGKWTSSEHRVDLSVAGYYIDWKNPQIPVELGGACPLSGFGTNAGKAEVYGGEVELSLRPTDAWQLWFGIAYTDASVAERLGFPGARNVVAEKGSNLPDIPDWTASALSDYRVPIGGQWQGYLRLDYRYTGRQPSDFTNTLYRENVNLLNVRIGVVSDDRWDVSLYADNALDDDPSLGPFTFGNTAGGGARFNDYTVRPRTIGLALRKSF